MMQKFGSLPFLLLALLVLASYILFR